MTEIFSLLFGVFVIVVAVVVIVFMTFVRMAECLEVFSKGSPQDREASQLMSYKLVLSGGVGMKNFKVT